MQRFIEGEDRAQAWLLPASLAHYLDADNPARVIEALLRLWILVRLALRVVPAAAGRPAHHPAMVLKLYIYVSTRARGVCSSAALAVRQSLMAGR
jgi:transposase